MRTLETDRLRMVPFAMEHLRDLHELWTDPEVRRYLWDDEVISLDKAREVVESSVEGADRRGYGLWALFLKHDPERLMGFCGFRPFEGGDQPELLYGILPDHWGKGYVHEAATAAIREAFDEYGFTRILALTDTPNQASVRVMQRLGMVFDGRREHHGLDTVFYQLTPEDYAEHLELNS